MDFRLSREGNLPDIKSCGSFHQFLEEIHDIYGDIASFFFGPKLCVSIASPELFKEQSKVFDRPGINILVPPPLIMLIMLMAQSSDLN